MPLPSQFTLSLELAQLVPFGPKDVLELARSLLKSGSDLVTEEDLILVFGRNQLDAKFDNSFKEVLRTASQQTILSEALNIIIEGGPGPTVQRCIKDPARFSTVVQLSMLTWAHDKRALAVALSEAMRRRSSGAPPEEQSSPGEGVILGVLKACEEQTSSYPWHLWFEAIRHKLGLQYPIAYEYDEELEELTLTVATLQACLDMLAAVKSFPENRLLHFQGRQGVVTLVVWAHCLMGLNVSVRNSPVGNAEFGSGSPCVIVDMDVTTEPKICLLDASNDLILAIAGDGDEGTIDAEVKYVALGYGTMVLRSESLNDGAISEMAHLAASMAWCMSRKLTTVISPIDEDMDDSKWAPAPRPRSKGPKRSEALCTDENNLFLAGSFLFGGIDMRPETVREYLPLLTERPFDSHLPIPPAVNIHVQQVMKKGNKGTWSQLVTLARELAIVILALSNVSCLKECELWRLGCLNSVKSSTMVQKTMRWDGKKHIPLRHDDWYDLLGRLMLGRKFVSPGPSCTISNWGWSMWMSTFSDIDPLGVVPGLLTVRNGVPSRNGERRNKVVDGPVGGFAGPPPRVCETSGDSATSRCTLEAIVNARMTGIRDDQFVVSVRFSSKDGELRTGYREMHRLRWNTFILRDCSHQPTATVELPIGTATVVGTDWNSPSTSSTIQQLPRVCASLVRGNRAARWMAIIGADLARSVVLAGENCCLSCSIHQASVLRGDLVVVC